MNQKESKISENKRRNREREEIENKRKEYYEKHMTEEMERLNKLVDWYRFKLNEIKEAPVDSRPRQLGKLYQCSQKKKNLGVTITRFGTLNPVDYPKYPPELELPEYEDNEDIVYYDSATASALPAGYKTYNHNKYFNKTIKMYQGHLNVDEELIDSIRKLLGPRTDGYTVNEVKDTIGMFKFEKDLVNSVVRNLNEVPAYKPITEFQRSSLRKYYEDFRINSDKVLGTQVKYKSNMLFHLLRLVGCKPNPDDFPLN